MLVDTHAHVQLADYDENREAVLDRARAAAVGAIVAVGVDVPSSRAAIVLASKHADVYATVGLHPHDAAGEKGEIADEDVAILAELITADKVVAVGECGLDYFRNNSPRDSQIKVFRAQIELAIMHDKPMVWHVRDAFEDFFNVIDDYPTVRGIVHCFTGTRAEMETAVAHNFLVAYNGIMTFTKDPAQLETVKATPLESIVLETDCPWLSPKSHRGKPNEPAYVAETAQFLADLRGETFTDFSAATSQNAANLLGLDV